MKYTIKIQYNDGTVVGWVTKDRWLVKYILNEEGRRYDKQIIRAIVRGELI